MRRLASFVVLTWLISVISPARADESAREIYERATAAFALQNYNEAAGLYERAFAIKPDPALLYNAAQSHRMAGNNKRALRLYQNYLKLYGNRIQNRAEVERHIAILKNAIAVDEQAAGSIPNTPRAPSETHGETTTPTTPPTAPPPVATTTPPAQTTTPAVVATAPPPAREERPIWKKAWFWGAVGGAVVVVALGVGLGVGLSGSNSNPTPSVGSFAGN